MNLSADSALILAALILIFSILWLINSGKKTPFLPPGPRGLPIVGYLPFLSKDLHHQFTELAGKYGPIYKLWLGNKLCTVISSPSLIKEVLRDHDTIFANRDTTIAARIATYDFNDIAWSPYGSQWRNLRKLFVREMLSNTNLEATYNLRKEEVRKAVKQIYSKIGTPIDICELAFKIDLNVIINLIWGGKIQGERRDKILTSLLPVLADMLDLLVKPNISDFFPVLAKFDIQGVAKEMTTLLRCVEGITKDAIDERMKNPSNKMEAVVAKKEGRTDFLQILVDLMQEEDNKESLGEAQIKAMLINILVGGTDTSSTTIEWVMTELLCHPKVMEKVQNELNEIVGLNNIVEEFHIPKLEYLDAVLKETLRLHPIGPFLTPRTPSQTCTIGGYTIPKDSAVFLNVWSIQRDPLAWENPLKFKPERFLGNTTKWDFSGSNFNYIPFGSGRRICAGLPLAERMIRYVLASLLHSFEWQLPEGEKLDTSDKLVMALRKKIPLTAVPIPRLCNSDLYE
ncbi:UNVERIFIED_CONTAM: Labd-13Z-ene-9,15,16-triol synthase, chloroplastic [Sesamum radiatum]|uniref:Labd-13Z-ene-9,15,16-triol synthase, chloroplastic n=1 Tax=Sesamum radiatum TaxID=300843 RepID=A0AAW2L2J5_SESRA